MHKHRGFVLLELLIVLAVIAILAGAYFNHGSGQKDQQSTYEMSIGRSQSAVCKANRAAMISNIQMFKLNNPNTPVDSEHLKKAGVTIATCPDGGAYGFTKEGTILCSKHTD